MKTEIKASATITLTFGKQKVELTMAEAKKLLSELQELVGPKITIPALPQIEREPAPSIPFPWDRFPNTTPTRPARPNWRENEVTCRGGYDDQRHRRATLCLVGN